MQTDHGVAYMNLEQGHHAWYTHNGTAVAERMRLSASGELSVGGGSNLGQANHFTVDVASASRYVRLTLDNNTTGAHQYSLHSIGDGDSANGSFGIYDDTANAWRQKIDGSGNTTFSGNVEANTFAAKTDPGIGYSMLYSGWSGPNGKIYARNTSGAPAANMVLGTSDASGTVNNVLQLHYNANISLGHDLGVTQLHKTFSTSHTASNQGKNQFFGLSDGSFGGMIVENKASDSGSHNAQEVAFNVHRGGISSGEAVRITMHHLSLIHI